jgi:hypothetical protein
LILGLLPQLSGVVGGVDVSGRGVRTALYLLQVDVVGYRNVIALTLERLSFLSTLTRFALHTLLTLLIFPSTEIKSFPGGQT